MKLVDFTPDRLPQAAALLAARHARDRHALPDLPARFEAADAAQVAVAAAWQRPHASGAAAVEGDQLLGYLIGDLVIDTVRGRSAWVRPAGLALAVDQEAELARDLYAAAAPRWLAWGCFDHFAVLPVADPAQTAAWFSLSFGLEQVHALCSLDTADPAAPAAVGGVHIRRAGPGDEEVLADLSRVIRQHQAGAPVWGVALPEATAEARSGYAELAADTNVTVWLAERDGQALGFAAFFPAEIGAADTLTPDQCVELKVAGTVPASRGLGVGRALCAHGLAQARAAGYRYCMADWRSTNLLASRFWPRQGFRPMHLRLVRRVDQRAQWATGHEA
jgi:ribosomal protein S18 acetylase RimI-like enzyme